MAISLCLSLIGAQALHSVAAFASPVQGITVGGMLYGGPNQAPTSWEDMPFAGGEVSAATVPQKAGYQFISAYVPNPENPENVLYISALKLNEAGTAIEITPQEHQTTDQVKLLVPLSEASQKIKFLYTKTAEWANVTYVNNTLEGKGIVTGPSVVQIIRDAGYAYFTVSVPRNERPVLPKVDNGATVKFYQDLSTPDRTVYQYELTISQDTTVTVSSEAKSMLSITARNSQNTDWLLGYPAGKFADKEIVLPSNTSYKPGGSVTFNVYHDRVISSPVTFTSFLAALRINGQVFGVPQPLGRYGQSKYASNSVITIPGYLNRANPQAKYSQWYQDYLTKTPWATPSFSAFQGYNPFWVPDQTSNDPFASRAWWREQVANKIIGEETTQYVDTGSLAGATIKIKILDAIPYMQTRQLGEYAPGQKANTSTYTRGAMTNNGRGSERPWKNNGFGLSLRMAYQITIENAPADMTVSTEWVASNNFKIGPYLNYGVDGIQVKASAIGYKPAPEPSAIQWRDLYGGPDPGWIDGAALAGTTMDPSNQGHSNFRVLGNADPHLEIRGNVINGYRDPYYLDASETPMQKGHPYMSLQNTAQDGKGWQGSFPTFTVGFDWLTDMNWYYWGQTNPVNCYGGMNIVGVRTHLMHIPVAYDLDGGTVPAGSEALYPNLNTASAASPEAASYKVNVESNPIIRIPSVTPSRNNGGTESPLVFFELYRQSPDGLKSTGRTYLPGANIDIRQESQVGGRLSDISGNAQVNAFVLKAIYADDLAKSKDLYRVERNYYRDGKLVNAQPEVVTEFIGVPGIQAELSPELTPENLEYQGNNFSLENPLTEPVVDLSRNLVVYTLKYNYHQPTMAETFNPQASPLDITYGNKPTEEELSSHITGTIDGKADQALPLGSTVTIIDNSLNTTQPGEQEVKVKIVYPDKSESTVTMKIKVVDNRDSSKYTPKVSPLDEKYGSGVPNLENAISNKAELPSGTKFEQNTSGIDMTKPGIQEGEVTVIYPDGSRTTVKVPVTVKTAADSFTPKAKALSVDKNQALTSADAKAAIENANELPAGTQFSFTNPVNTKDTGTQQTDVKITYPDGSETTVPVTVNVYSQGDKWVDAHGALEGVVQHFPYGAALNQDQLLSLIKEGESLKGLITSVTADPQVNASPKTKEAHTQKLTMSVRFKDGSVLTTAADKQATAIIDDESDNYQITAKKISMDITKPLSEQELKDALTVADNKSLPEGTKVALKPGSLNADSAGDKSATIVVTFPDGSTKDVPVQVQVIDNRDSARFTPQVQPLKVGYGSGTPDLANAITNRADLPPGTQFEPNTSGIDMTKPGVQEGEVTVIYPDGSRTTIKVPVTVKTAAESFAPKVQPVEVPLGQTPGDIQAKAAIANADLLPAGTKFSFTAPVDTSKAGSQQVQIKIEYPDGSETTVSSTVDVVSESQKWVKAHGALEGVTQHFAYGSQITKAELLSLVKNSASLKDLITSIAAKPVINTSPESEAARTQPAAITVTFKDGSVLTTAADKLAVAIIDPASASYKLSALPFDVNIFDTPTENQLKNSLTDAGGKALPEGTKVALASPADFSVPGLKKLDIVVTFPDGSKEEVPARITVVDNRDSAKYEPHVKTLTVPYGSAAPNLESAITNTASFPKGTKLQVMSNSIDTTKPGLQSGTVKVLYPDGSEDVLSIPVHVKSAAQSFDPQAVSGVEYDYGQTLTSANAKDALETAGLPAGTRYQFKAPVDTNVAGEHKAVIVVSYPDGSSTDITVPVQVRTQSQSWLHNTGLTKQSFAHGVKIPWGAVVSKHMLQSLVPDAKSLPGGVVISTEPAINTKPAGAGEHKQTVVVVLHFADGSSLKQEVEVIIGAKPIEPVKPPIGTVDQKPQSKAESSSGHNNLESGKLAPAGDSFSLMLGVGAVMIAGLGVSVIARRRLS